MAEAKDTKATAKPAHNTNPSGASKEQLEAGERVGKPLHPDVDPTFHVYEFDDPQTGEPLKTERTVHDDSGYVK
jgi:hypothetical protein